jgi:tetratricopeptide (TPR) repeat protein
MSAFGGRGFAGACLLALAALLAAYSNHFDNDFHFDDTHVIVDNLSIRGLHDIGRFFTDATTFTSRPQNAVYRPLLTLSYAIDYRLGGGLNPRQFHRTQFLLLVALGVGLVALFKLLLDRAGPTPAHAWAALVAATLFCIHTANTQTVNYLSSRSDLASTLGVVLAFLVYLGWPRGRGSQLHLLPALAGGLCKPLAVMYGPLLFLYVLLLEERRGLVPVSRAALRASLRKAAPALAAGLALFVVLRRMDADTLEYARTDRWTYARTQPFVWLHYARLFLLPRGLTADTDWEPLASGWDLRLFAGGLFVAALAAAVVWLSRHERWRPVAFGLAWFAIALLPTSSVFPLSEVTNEHRLFFPFVGLSLASVWAAALGIERWAGPRRTLVATALAVATLAAHGVGTHVRNRVWKDGESLWRDVAEKSPRNARGLMNYGLVRMARGELAEALALFERAATITPNYSILEINLGIVKSALGDAETGERHFLRALSLEPDYAQGHYYYARWLVAHARAPQALPHLEQAVALSPGDVDVNRLLLDFHAARGDREALVARARQVLTLAPDEPAAQAYLDGRVPYEAPEDSAEAWASLAFQKLGEADWLAAATLYRRSLELDAAVASSWNDLGWTLAQAGFRELAPACFERALALDPALERARANLDWARRGYPGPVRRPTAVP